MEAIMKSVRFVLAVAMLCGFSMGVIAAENQPSRVRDNLDGTLTDTAAGLIWIRDYKKAAKNIQEARAICAELQYGGQKGWRLPTSAELSQFIKYLRSIKNPSVDFAVLKEADKSAFFWTSTDHSARPKEARWPGSGV